MSNKQTHNRFDEELVCVDSLAHCLKQHCGCQEVKVERERDDPPDFWLTIDGEKYAAEVTSIVTGEGYRAHATRLANTVQDSARDAGVLSGLYGLVIRGYPPIPKSSSAEWRALVEKATSYIDDTQDVDSAPEANLLKDGRNHLSITKFSGEGATVGTMGPVEAKREGEVREELRELIEKCVFEKRHKLEKKRVRAKCPRIILLLYDAYGWGEIEDAKEALLQAGDHRWFHSVFWAASFTDRPNDLSPSNPGRVGRFIYSKKAEWR